MQVSIDGQEYATLTTTGQTLEQLLNQVKTLLADSGRMIVGIVCDDELVSPDQLQQMLSKPAENFSRVEFQTAIPLEIARNSLDACDQYLSEITSTLDTIVDALRQARVQDAMNKMGPMFSRINETFQGTRGVLKLLKIDPQSVELSTGSAAGFLDGMIDHLKEIKHALETQDYIALADLLEYELDSRIKNWQQLIANLREHITEGGNNGDSAR